ncbi:MULTISPECIES: hypothetical protein [unclassified Streptomyces]|uniref:hypothetical protein n=1 Tax=Streptomyces sp. SID8377 TaxID=2690357 RepID=UPI001EF11F71|nr:MULTISPECIES: hypothetical protein [unclassified Streptomyces]
MGGQVVEGITDPGQFPVDGPQVSTRIDDEVLPVKITMDQSVRPGLKRTLPPEKPAQCVVVDPERVEDPPEPGAVLFVDVLNRVHDQVVEEPVRVLGYGLFSVITRKISSKGAGVEDRKAVEDFLNLVEMPAIDPLAPRLETAERHPFDEREPRHLPSHMGHLGDTRDRSLEESEQRLL